MPLQRSLQNGLYAFCELNKLGPPQVGQGTWRGLDKGSLIGVSQKVWLLLARFRRRVSFRRECLLCWPATYRPLVVA